MLSSGTADTPGGPYITFINPWLHGVVCLHHQGTLDPRVHELIIEKNTLDRAVTTTSTRPTTHEENADALHAVVDSVRVLPSCSFYARIVLSFLLFDSSTLEFVLWREAVVVVVMVRW